MRSPVYFKDLIGDYFGLDYTIFICLIEDQSYWRRKRGNNDENGGEKVRKIVRD